MPKAASVASKTASTTTVVALRHVAFETLGILEDLFAKRGWAFSYVDVPTADLANFDPLKPDLLVVLGGPIGVNDAQDYPFLTLELALLKKRLEADKPTLGICLGAQLIAKALGANVYRGPAPEIGWRPLLLTAAGHASPVKHLSADRTFMFHWHGDTFDLPQGAALLAGTETCLHQVFAWGNGTLAFQCHPEVRTRELENWFVGHTVEIAKSAVTTVRMLRTDTLRYGPALEKQGAACIGEWLDSLKL
ncbi:MAG: glutamine amidotransferase [Rhodospirillaceae bacterium]|nr:MAG: glutamine amidotransferase [Rhodospirillaceae bacterium]